MRAAWFVVASLAIAVVVQVSVLNGLPLPGGGVPDLVLVLGGALAMASGPVTGMLIGFGTGLCLDLAPPGSELVGQYALVFCLAGWAAGRLRPAAGHAARHSAGLVATGLLALVVAGGEVLSAAVVKLVTPAAVTLSQLRLVLPSTIVYNLVLCPFVLSSVMLSSTIFAQRSATVGLTRVLPGTTRSRRAAKRSGGLPDLHLARNTRPAIRHAAPVHRSRARLRPAAGVPGSATGLRRDRSRPAAPVRIRFAGGKSGLGAPGPGRHPGQLAGGGRAFRPHVDRPAVPAQAQRRPVTINFARHRGEGSLGQALGTGRSAAVRPRTISFAGHRGDGSLGQALGTGRSAPVRPRTISFAPHRGDGSLGQALGTGRSAPVRPRTISFAGHRGDGSFGRTLATASLVPRQQPRQPAIHFGTHTSGSSSGAQLRMGVRRTAIAAGAVPRLTFARNHVPVQQRAPAVPRFGRGAASRKSPAIVPGGVLGESTVRARRRQAAPRLRLSRVKPGMLGGSGRPMLARPPGRPGKRPRFSYGKRSPLSLLTGSRVGRRLGGRWLARHRAGGRAGVWLLGRRAGGHR